jgi:GNAT superfamily N-acetyltransferase
MEISEVSTFSLEDAAALAGGEVDPYGTEHLGITWKPGERHVVVIEAGRTIGHAGFLPIEVEAGGGMAPGVGLGGVMVHSTVRGRGIGELMVRETTARMGATGRPFAMLFCRDVRLPFYERMGWQQVHGEVIVDQENGPMVMPLLTCWYLFTPDLDLPREGLRVLGLPF